ncbi:MAG TPA: response regulator [Nitrososphaeraceae archaeon]
MAAAKTIAIIDDEVDLVNLFQEALEKNGFKVCAFTDPIHAFNILEKKIQEYGLILSDFRMPNLNGHELCTKLRQLNPELEVILMSAYDIMECDTSKFTIVKKPILIAQLLQIVRDSLEYGDDNNSIIYDTKNSKPIIVVKDSSSQLSESPTSSSSTINIADTVNKKDERLALVEISKGLIELLQDAGFTIEMILNSKPADIAEILGIDVYVGEIIYNETKKHLGM